MKQNDDVVSASEIASYSFCPEAWRLGTGLGVWPNNEDQLARGEQFHAKIAEIEISMQAASRLGLVLIVLGVLALVLYLAAVIFR